MMRVWRARESQVARNAAHEATCAVPDHVYELPIRTEVTHRLNVQNLLRLRGGSTDRR